MLMTLRLELPVHACLWLVDQAHITADLVGCPAKVVLSTFSRLVWVHGDDSMKT